MQQAPQSAPMKAQYQRGKESTFTRSEKTKDIRSTNITAAKGSNPSI